MGTKHKLTQGELKKQSEKHVRILQYIQILLENIKNIFKILYVYWFVYFFVCLLEIFETLPDTERLLEFSRKMWTANAQASAVTVVCYILIMIEGGIGLWRRNLRYVFTKIMCNIVVLCFLLAVLQNQPLISGPDAFTRCFIILSAGAILVNGIENLIGTVLAKYGTKADVK